MTARVYLDWNATAPLRTEAREAMIAAMEVVGNPSSVHAEGRAAKALVERARAQVAEAFGAQGFDIVFTSGATEAAALALGAGWSRVLASPVEHDCIETWRGADWQDIALDDAGVVPPATLRGLEPGPGDLAVVQAANSETGIVQPIADICSVVGAAGASALIDVVQFAGKLPLAMTWQGPALYMLSAHKFGGPKGVGALVVPRGTDMPAQLRGGGQEMGRRAGTENVIGIAGMGAAAVAAARDLAAGLWDEVRVLRDWMEEALLEAAPNARVVGKGVARLPNTTCLVTPGRKGETQVMHMDLAGHAISAGSACSSGKVKASRVLQAMGLSTDLAGSAIRISIGPATRRADIGNFVSAWGAAYARHRARAS